MSDQKATPGPWRVNSAWIEGPKMALRVAVVDWPTLGCAPKSAQEAKANARLIAAAPAIRDALTDLLDYVGQLEALVYAADDKDDHAAVAAARLALSQADGAQHDL